MKKNKEVSAFEKLIAFESQRPDIAAMYARFLVMTKEQWAVRYQEWDAYYAVCKNSRLAEIYVEMGKQLHSKNKTLLKKLHAEAKELLIKEKFITKPKTDDPYFFKYDSACNQYKQLLKQSIKESKLNKN